MPAILGHEQRPHDSDNALPAQLVPLSYLLAKLLRHGSRSLEFTDDGWCRILDVLERGEFSCWTQQDVEAVVRSSMSKGRPRFALQQSDDLLVWIRATSKHSCDFASRSRGNPRRHSPEHFRSAGLMGASHAGPSQNAYRDPHSPAFSGRRTCEMASNPSTTGLSQPHTGPSRAPASLQPDARLPEVPELGYTGDVSVESWKFDGIEAPPCPSCPPWISTSPPCSLTPSADHDSSIGVAYEQDPAPQQIMPNVSASIAPPISIETPQTANLVPTLAKPKPPPPRLTASSMKQYAHPLSKPKAPPPVLQGKEALQETLDGPPRRDSNPEIFNLDNDAMTQHAHPLSKPKAPPPVLQGKEALQETSDDPPRRDSNPEIFNLDNDDDDELMDTNEEIPGTSDVASNDMAFTDEQNHEHEVSPGVSCMADKSNTSTINADHNDELEDTGALPSTCNHSGGDVVEQTVEPLREFTSIRTPVPIYQSRSKYPDSDIAGRIWFRYRYPPGHPRKGTWWWMDDGNLFDEEQPGQWQRFRDPDNGCHYWWDSCTDEYFYSEEIQGLV